MRWSNFPKDFRKFCYKRSHNRRKGFVSLFSAREIDKYDEEELLEYFYEIRDKYYEQKESKKGFFSKLADLDTPCPSTDTTLNVVYHSLKRCYYDEYIASECDVPAWIYKDGDKWVKNTFWVEWKAFEANRKYLANLVRFASRDSIRKMYNTVPFWREALEDLDDDDPMLLANPIEKYSESIFYNYVLKRMFGYPYSKLYDIAIELFPYAKDCILYKKHLVGSFVNSPSLLTYWRKSYSTYSLTRFRDELRFLRRHRP